MHRHLTLAVLIILLVYLALSVGTAHALRPWVDEGWYGTPAWSLAFRGYMGTPSFYDPGLKDVSRYSYWIMPLYPVLQAGWYRIFGFSLASLRAISVLCVLFGMVAWTMVFRRLTGDAFGALLFMALMACDYISLAGAASGRPDAMAFLFQAIAFATYLHWRERSLRLAILISQTFVVASGLTHPNGGMLSFFGVLWLVLYFDRARIRLPEIAIAGIPYLVGAIGWGAYIAKDPSAFVAQYGYQISGRSHVLFAPWAAMRDELVRRYLTNMGLAGHSPGSVGPHYLKALIFIAYAIGIVGLLAIPSLRGRAATRVLLGLIAIDLVFYTFLEGTKASYYLIYFVYPLTAALVVFVRWCWQNYSRARPLFAVALAGLFLVQIGGAAYRIHRDAWHREYMPAVAYLQTHAKPGDLIIGSHDLGFTLGFQKDFMDDSLLGLQTGKRANFIVIEEVYRGRFDTLQLRHPDQFANVQQILSNYQVVYDNGLYQVLALRETAPPAT